MSGAFNLHCKIAFKTLQEARAAGYTESGEYMLQVGYIGKKADTEAMPVYIAGKGKRGGQLFYLRHNGISTRYCVRVYLTRREEGAAV